MPHDTEARLRRVLHVAGDRKASEINPPDWPPSRSTATQAEPVPSRRRTRTFLSVGVVVVTGVAIILIVGRSTDSHGKRQVHTTGHPTTFVPATASGSPTLPEPSTTPSTSMLSPGALATATTQTDSVSSLPK